jgi:hypothetical protein
MDDKLLFGLVISTITAIITSLINNWLQERREERQWQRQQKLAEQNWQRDKLLEIYMNCIASVTSYLSSGESTQASALMPSIPGQSFVKYQGKYIGDLEMWLTLLVISHSGRESPQIQALESEMKTLPRGRDQLREIQYLVTELAKADVRLSIMNSANTTSD